MGIIKQGFILIVVFVVIACGVQQPIIRPATSTARMKHKTFPKDTKDSDLGFRGYYLQIGYTHIPSMAISLKYLGNDSLFGGQRITFSMAEWGGVTNWLDVGVVGNLSGFPMAFALQGQILQEKFLRPAVAVQAHIGLHNSGLGMVLSKSIKTWQGASPRQLGFIEILSSLSYHHAIEGFGLRLPSIEGLKKRPEARDQGLESKDFFDAFIETQTPFIMLPLGIEIGYKSVRFGVVRTWRLYLNQNANSICLCDDWGPPEYSNIEACKQLIGSVPDFVTDVRYEREQLIMWMFYLAIGGSTVKPLR